LGWVSSAVVALLALALRDRALARELVLVYMPRLDERDHGSETLRETLRAYFQTGRNVSAAAATLGVDRRTIRYRLRTIEERVSYPLEQRLSELEVVLRFYDLLEHQGVQSR
jgi:DNA-binding PucR family transcriptional regulator